MFSYSFCAEHPANNCYAQPVIFLSTCVSEPDSHYVIFRSEKYPETLIQDQLKIIPYRKQINECIMDGSLVSLLKLLNGFP
jgi:hypothetical protein